MTYDDERKDPLGYVSGPLRVPQEMLRSYTFLHRYLKREMAKMLAAEGRGEDDRLAHVATGEMVVPRKLLHDDPWLRSYLVRSFEDARLDWRQHLVGPCNRINPSTGLAEFDPEHDEGFDLDRGGYGFNDGGFNEAEAGYHPDQDIRDDNNLARAGGNSGRIDTTSNAVLSSVTTPSKAVGVQNPFSDINSAEVLSMGQYPGGELPGIPAPAALGVPPTSYGDVPYEDVVTNAPARNSGFGVNTDWNPFDYQNADFGQPSASGGNALAQLRNTSINPPEEYSGLLNMIWDKTLEYQKLEAAAAGANFNHFTAQKKSTPGTYDLPIPTVPTNPKEYGRLLRTVPNTGIRRVPGTTLADGNEVGKAAWQQMKPLETFLAAKEAERLQYEFDQSFEDGFQRWLDKQLEQLGRLDRELGINREPN